MNHPAPSMRPFGAEASATWIAAASLYFLLAASMIHFTSDGLAIATVWPANAVLVALLLLVLLATLCLPVQAFLHLAPPAVPHLLLWARQPPYPSPPPLPYCS